MTRRRKNASNNKGGRKKKDRDQDNWDGHDSRAIETENANFEKYYKAQGIVPEAEWDAFMQALRRPLPSTFRIAGHRDTREDIKKSIVETYVPQLQSASFEGEPLPVPKSIPWYPGGLAWKIDVEKKSLRKSPEYKKFHSFLVYETDVGNISRQEAVSMIPPLFLDVQPHHYVIDMCAAPGSKTSQILEAMHLPSKSSSENEDKNPSGLLIANDSDYRRAQLLVHTTARLPTPGIMVTNLDVSNFPIIKIPSSSPSAARDTEPTMHQLRFHRILSDVPCSGDGTLRKNIRIWKTWSPMDGNGLHSLQLRILQRAMRMLVLDFEEQLSTASSETTKTAGITVNKEKGRIVYSTCSFNPVENEAVVAAALNTVPGFEVVDVSAHFPELERRPGLTSWQPAIDRDVDISCKTYQEYDAKFEESVTKDSNDTSKADRPKRNKYSDTLWPPANSKELGLEKCMRIYPHLQDSGGFFITVLQRKTRRAEGTDTVVSDSGNVAESQKRPVPDEDDEDDESLVASKKVKLSEEDANGDGMQVDEPVAPEEEQKTKKSSGKKAEKQKTGHFKENPFTFIPPDDPGVLGCIKRLRLSPDFPSGNIFVRNPVGEPTRSLYLVNDTVKMVMQSTDYTRIRLVSAGVKMFGRSEFAKQAAASDPSQASDELQFRVLSEGMLTVLNYADKSTFIQGDVDALRTLLKSYFPLLSSFSDSFRAHIESRAIGSHIGCFKAGDYEGTRLNHDLIYPLWKSEQSICLMIDKTAKKALSLRLFGEDITAASSKDGEQAAGKKIEPSKDVDEVLVPADDVEEQENADDSDAEDS
ncbi:cytosine-5--methyltransferase [Schizopora paradoxa]|uniref:Cytosine-5--methyltransferase n=1 Tax=Schizopora paradoxa TaxID=27342 RepID=A0A0H2RDR5_9AGAM|nr:cytosine-5--methyltransferase [Schizopora paradoxa]